MAQRTEERGKRENVAKEGGQGGAGLAEKVGGEGRHVALFLRYFVMRSLVDVARRERRQPANLHRVR